jgi:hypothetical protein
MNKLILMVLNVEIPVMYIREIVHIHVKCVKGHSVESKVLKDISAYTAVSVLTRVMYVIRLSVNRALL